MTVQTDATAGGELKKLPMPDVGDFVFLFVMWLNLFVIPNHLFEDGSTGWHVVAGDFILKTGTIPYVDLFSNSFPTKEWVAYEWLYDFFMAFVIQCGGLKLLAVVLTAAIAFLFLSIYDRIRREGAGIWTAFWLVIVAILTSAMHWLARPHLVTFWCVWIFATVLEDFYRGTVRVKKLFLLLCPLMLVWVNCHPAFMLGLIITSIFVVSTVVQSKMNALESERSKFAKQRNWLLILLVALFAITFLNPYGYHLHQYILGYLRGSEILAATDEYLSPVFKGGLHLTCLEILFFSFTIGLFVCQRRITLPGFITCLAFGYASLTAQRNMPLYAIVATPYIGGLLARHTFPGNGKTIVASSAVAHPHSLEPSFESQSSSNSNPSLNTDVNSSSDASFNSNSNSEPGSNTKSESEIESQIPTSTLSQSPSQSGSFLHRIKNSLGDFEEQEAHCKMHLLPIAYTLFLIGVAVTGGSFLGKPFLTSTFDPKLMPVETAQYIKDNKVDMQHLFNYDNWGGYLRYTTGQRVFIDDRADFYGQNFYARYSTAMVAAEGWQNVLDESKIDWVLFPKNSALATTLQTDKDWKVAASDQASILFQRLK